MTGLHWSPDGSEVWFTAGRTWGWTSPHAATLDGEVRCLLQTPANLMLRDVYRDGRVLLESGTWTNEVWGRGPDDTVERSYSWLDGGPPRAVSPEGFRVAAPGNPVSPDGTRIAAFPDDAGRGPVFVSVEDGTVRSIDGLGPGDVPRPGRRTGNRSS